MVPAFPTSMKNTDSFPAGQIECDASAGMRIIERGVSGVVKVVRVFEVITESELANTQPKTLAQPDPAASAAVVRP